MQFIGGIMLKRIVAASAIGILLAGTAFAAGLEGSQSFAKPASPKPGSYDYLVLALSWSPTFCGSSSGHADREQCGGTNKFGFVAHGLWPVFPRGSGSAAHGCGENSSLTDKSAEKVQNIMPSRKLINHEWEKHGTCFGGDASAYFGKVKTAWDKVKIPQKFKSPAQDSKITADQVRKAFIEANPTIPPTAIAVTCQKPRGKMSPAERPLMFKEVRLCMDKDLNFKACGSQVRDRCAGDAQLPPIR
jgi:ribonuclease T2